MKKHWGQKSIITAGILLLLLLAFAGTAAAQEGVTYLSSGSCMAEEVENPNCTANDVQYSGFTVIKVIDGCESTSDTFTAQIKAEAIATANARYDIGFWIGLTDYAASDPDAESGDGALYGESCYRQILSPLTTVLTEVDATSGVGPYASLDQSDDFCGDIQQGVPTFANMPFGVTAESTAILTLPCLDPDEDGVVNVDACTSWENNPGVVCESVADALPGTRSKCNCGSFNITGMIIEPALRKIIVDKVTPQKPGSTEVFSFTLDSAPVDTAEQAFAPVAFTLTDGQEPFDSGNLAAGTYRVVEGTPPSGWSLEKAACVDSAGKTHDPASIDLTGASNTVTCTFTNTFEPPISGAPLPFLYVLIGAALLGAGSAGAAAR